MHVHAVTLMLDIGKARNFWPTLASSYIKCDVIQHYSSIQFLVVHNSLILYLFSVLEAATCTLCV